MERGGLGIYYTIMIEKDGHIYEIIFGNRTNKGQLSDTEKKILSTFKFLKESKKISDRGIYRNEEYGFELQYPLLRLAGFFSPEDTKYRFEFGKQLGDSLRIASSPHFIPTRYEINVRSNPQNLSAEEFFFKKMEVIRIGGLNKEDLGKIEDIMIGSQKIKAKKILWNGEFFLTVLVKKGDIIIEIQGFSRENKKEFLETFNKILASFKFLK